MNFPKTHDKKYKDAHLHYFNYKIKIYSAKYIYLQIKWDGVQEVEKDLNFQYSFV